MAENSKIEWTHHTFNPWIGCTKVHTGCAHCYAEEMMDHRYGKAKWGPNGTRVRTTEANWRKPLQWNRAAEAAGERHRVFCASLADVFESWDGDVVDAKARQLLRTDIQGRITMDDMRADLFRLIDATPNLDWLLLTKRPENVRRMWPEIDIQSQQQADDRNERGEMFRRNVWLGTSISDQQTANVAVPRLLESRDLCPVLFLSAEPVLGAIDLTDITDGESFLDALSSNKASVDWVIVGGESGAGARRLEVEWARRIARDCQSARVPVFVKQMGGFVVDRNDAGFELDADNLRAWPEPRDVRHHINGFREDYQGADCRVVLSDGKGGDWNEWPLDMRVREFPLAATS